MKRLLITGAAGNLGKICREGLKGYADVIRLSDISPMDPAGPNEEVVPCDLSDRAAVIELTKDVDGIIHLGGISIEAAFDDLLSANLAGTYNLYEAARQNGVGRIMFASSNHAIGFHERTTRLDEKSPQRPDSLYGVTKCYGEAMASYYYDKFDVETVSLRIGSCFEKPLDRRMLSTWMSPGDFISLMKAIFIAPQTGHLVMYGVSDNKSKWWSNDHAEFLGWKPKDSSEQFRAEIEAAFPPEDRHEKATIYQGGGFAARGHFED